MVKVCEKTHNQPAGATCPAEALRRTAFGNAVIFAGTTHRLPLQQGEAKEWQKLPPSRKFSINKKKYL